MDVHVRHEHEYKRLYIYANMPTQCIMIINMIIINNLVFLYAFSFIIFPAYKYHFYAKFFSNIIFLKSTAMIG